MRRPTKGIQGDLLHAAAVGMAFVAVLGSLVTFASSEPDRPRILALVLAGLSATAALVGLRQFRGMACVDACLVLAADAWVLAYGGW